MRAKLRKVAKNKTPEGRESYKSLRREYKKKKKLLKVRVGRNSHKKLNIQAMCPNLLKVSTTAKIMP